MDVMEEVVRSVRSTTELTLKEPKVEALIMWKV